MFKLNLNRRQVEKSVYMFVAGQDSKPIPQYNITTIDVRLTIRLIFNSEATRRKLGNALNVSLCIGSTCNNGILIDFNFRMLILVQSSSLWSCIDSLYLRYTGLCLNSLNSKHHLYLGKLEPDIKHSNIYSASVKSYRYLDFDILENTMYIIQLYGYFACFWSTKNWFAEVKQFHEPWNYGTRDARAF